MTGGELLLESDVRHTGGGRLFAVLPLALLASETEEHAAAFLGIPLWIWQLANLALFLGVLLYFVARPIAAMFRKRQLEVEERLREAKAMRAEAARLDVEIAEIRGRAIAEGETERAALAERADREVERVRREAEAEIGRRLTAAKLELKQTAADLTASTARELLSKQITDDDRRRLLEESVARLGDERVEKEARP